MLDRAIAKLSRPLQPRFGIQGARTAAVMLVLLVASLTATMAIGVAGWWSGETMLVQAERVFIAKDVTADVLPPPLYLIETRLTVSLAVDGWLRPDEAMVTFDRLEREYRTRAAYWRAHPPLGLEGYLLGKQDDAAVRFLQSARTDVLLPLASGHVAEARAAIPMVHRLYLAHRAGVDETVVASRAFAQENATRFERVQKSARLRIGVVLAGAVLLTLSLFIVATNRLAQVNASLEKQVRDRTRDLLRSKNAAVAAAKVKSDFAANMGHEVRTPLNGILGLTRLALRTPLNTRQRDYIGKIHASAQTLLRIVNDILDLSKIEAGKIVIEQSRFELDGVLNRAVQSIATVAAEKRLEIVIECAPEVPETVIGDSSRLEQVLVNLASNAVKFTVDGEVSIGADLVSDDGARVVVRFTVRDTGIGMTFQQKLGLFGPLGHGENQAARRFGGTRLGLVISRRLVRLMGGDISVVSEPGRGSAFSFTVDLMRSDERNSSTQPIRESLKGLRALVVDDNKTSMHTVAQMLRALGMVVTTLSDGRAALAESQRARLTGQPYEFTIVDWQMPHMDGLQIIGELRRADAANTCFLMVTANERAELEGRALTRRFDGFVLKPTTLSTLFNTVVEALGALPRPEQPATIAEASQRLRRGARILVVDDNPISQIVTGEALVAMGATAEIANSGEMALDCLKTESFDAVLMDVELPGIDGFQTAISLRELPNCARLPVIAMTANTLADDREKCLRAGMDDYLAKPIGVAAIAACLGRWLPSDDAFEDTGPGGSPSFSTPSEFRADLTPPLDLLERLESNIPGFDLAGTVKRLGGSAARLVDLLGIFSSTAIDMPDKLRAQTRLKETRAIAQTLHALRGSAATVGLQGIVDASDRLELEIRTQADFGRARELNEVLCVVLEASLSEIERVLAGAVTGHITEPMPLLPLSTSPLPESLGARR